MRLPISCAAAIVLSGALTIPAFAHVTLESPTAPAGSYKAVLRVPHGCDGHATVAVRVELPEGFIGAKPMPKAGWTLEVEKGPYARSYDLYGHKLTSGAKAITWAGGNLPDDFYDEFVVQGTLSGVEPGQKLYFKTKQTCDVGQTAWDQIPTEGSGTAEIPHPAPQLLITEKPADGSHGDDMAGMKMGGQPAAKPPAKAGQDIVRKGELELSNAWARAMLPGATTGGAYVTIANDGKEADRLVNVSSPLAGRAEIHSMVMDQGVMKMRPLKDGLEIPAGGKVELEPGSYHLMFLDVTKRFEQGGTVPVTLTFARAGTVELMLPVGSAGATQEP